MHKKETDIDNQEFIEKICQKGKNTQEYLMLLKKNGLITYLTFRQFRKQIQELTTYSPQFLVKLQAQYKDYLKETNKYQWDVKFPWVKHKDVEFAKTNIQRFMGQYRFPKVPKDKKEEKGKNKTFTAQDQQLFARSSTKVLSFRSGSSQKLTQKKKKLSRVQLPEERLKQKRQDEDISKIPAFFLNQKRAFATLTGLDLTMSFEKQLNDVTEMIKKQIHGNYLIRVFSDFLNAYMKTKYINEGFCQEKQLQQSQKLQIIKQIKEYSLEKSNQIKLIDCWNLINQRLQFVLHTKKRTQTDTIKRFLIQGINSVYIIFNLNIERPTVYGVTWHSAISINMNHLSSTTLNLTQFRQLLKPYFALTLYHQLAHFLIRKIQEVGLNSSGISFDYSNQTIGRSLLDKAYQYYTQIPPYLKLCQKEIKRTLNFKSFSQQVRSFLKSQEKFLDKLTQKRQKIQDIMTKVTNISQICSLTHSKVKQLNWEQYLEELDNYIEVLKTKSPEVSYETYISHKRHQYSFFFAYFVNYHLMRKLIKQNWAIQIYKKIIKKVKEAKITNFYYEDNQFIEAFIQKLQQSKEQTEQNEQKEQIQQNEQTIFRFNSTLVNRIIIQNLSNLGQPNYTEELQGIWIDLGAEEIEKFYQQSQSLLQDNQQDLQSTFKQFCLNKWTQFNKNNSIHFRFKQISYRLQKIIECVQFYQIFTNYIKYAQILDICNQMPYFYLQQKTTTSKLSKKFESGYVIEKIMFPTLQESHRIFAKDYAFMKKIEVESNRLQIGKRPHQLKQIQKSLVALKEVCQDLNIDMSHGLCGNFIRKLYKQDQQMQQKIQEDAKEKTEKQKSL